MVCMMLFSSGDFREREREISKRKMEKKNGKMFCCAFPHFHQSPFINKKQRTEMDSDFGLEIGK